MTAPKHDAHEDTSKRIFCFGFVLLVFWEYLTVHGKCLNGKGNGTFFLFGEHTFVVLWGLKNKLDKTEV